MKKKEEFVAITEMHNPRTAAIDTLSSLEIVRLISDEDAQVALGVAADRPGSGHDRRAAATGRATALLWRRYQRSPGGAGRFGDGAHVRRATRFSARVYRRWRRRITAIRRGDR